jgi:hypothetical protein
MTTPARFMVHSREETDPATGEQVEVFYPYDGTHQVGDDCPTWIAAHRAVKALNALPPDQQDAYATRLAPVTPAMFADDLQAAVRALQAGDKQALAKATQPMVETGMRAIRALSGAAQAVALIGWETAPWAHLDLSGRGDPARAAAGHLVELHIRHGQRTGWHSPIPLTMLDYAATIVQRDPTGEFTVTTLVHLLVMLGAVQAHRQAIHADTIRAEQ